MEVVTEEKVVIGCFLKKNQDKKVSWIIFSTPNAKMVVQNPKSGKMNQTTINDAYKKEVREIAYMLITRWMHEVVISFNAIIYPSFQPMIKTIDQYNVGMKEPTLHEIRVINLKKELALTKDLIKDHMVEWKKKMDVQLCRMDGPIGNKEFSELFG